MAKKLLGLLVVLTATTMLAASCGDSDTAPAEDHQGALDALGRFCDLYETGELPEFHDVAHPHGQTRSSPGTTPAGPPTAESRAPTTCSKLRRSAHGFTNPTNFEARGILVRTGASNPQSHVNAQGREDVPNV